MSLNTISDATKLDIFSTVGMSASLVLLFAAAEMARPALVGVGAIVAVVTGAYRLIAGHRVKGA